MELVVIVQLKALQHCIILDSNFIKYSTDDDVGSVKDSVVGEERIAQYLLAVLNSRSTPLHWKHLNNRRMEGIQYEPDRQHEYRLKDLLPKKTKSPNASDVDYIGVIMEYPLFFFFFFFFSSYYILCFCFSSTLPLDLSKFEGRKTYLLALRFMFSPIPHKNYMFYI